MFTEGGCSAAQLLPGRDPGVREAELGLGRGGEQGVRTRAEERRPAGSCREPGLREENVELRPRRQPPGQPSQRGGGGRGVPGRSHAPGEGAGPRAKISRQLSDSYVRKMSCHGPGEPPSLVPWAAALLLALGVERALALPEICLECPGSVQNVSEVARYCKQTPALMLHARCCLNPKGTILGLDLQNCSLEDLGPHFPQAVSAVVIDLQANPLKENLTDTFRGFTQLQTLVLPREVKCPGGIKAWDHVTDGKDNRTCLGQKNLCNDTRNPEMCPENGACAPSGPGLLQCVCADGFHGYKCLRQGSFSLLMFFGILGSATLSISVVLWGTQRRKVKAS